MSAKKVDDIYGLSPMQEGMLFHTLYAEEFAAYLDQEVYSIPGELDVAAFGLTWQHLFDRHTILRTSFHWEGLKEPLQIVHKDVQVHLDYMDWCGLSEADQNAKLDSFLKKDRERGMDISRAPLS